jgi:hypothetical protein
MKFNIIGPKGGIIKIPLLSPNENTYYICDGV